ncbi:MAG: diguanylate cyclase [Candidatus Hydrogenedentota bacterium]
MNTESGDILVVDDDPDLRSTIATRLRGGGFRVMEADCGESALAAASRRDFDLLLLDIMMPGLSGHDVLRQMRDRADTPPAVIFLTALGSSDQKLKGLYGGAQDYLTKPCDPDELLARVSGAIQFRRLLVQAQTESSVDPLTGIGNRRSFEAMLDREIARWRRYGHPIALISIDADGLKSVNDSFGHGAGDEFLKAIARAMRAACRSTDMPFRIGGDEFILLLPETDRAMADCFLGRLRETLAEERFSKGDKVIAPEASCGIAVLPVDSEEAEGLLKAADRDLYRSKEDHHRRNREVA